MADITTAAGAVLRDDSGWQMPASYGDALAEYAAAHEQAVLFDTSHRGKVEVSGKDAPSFLHNLSSNDINNLPLGAGCETFFCTAKAKVVSHAWIFHVLLDSKRHAYWVDLAPGQAELLIKHLDRFIIAEQVELVNRTNGFAQVHLAGPGAAAVLARALADEIPRLEPLQHMERTFGATVHANIRRNDSLGIPGFDIVCLAELATGLWRMLTSSGARPAGLDAFELLRVEAGTPIYGKDIDENRFAFDVGRTAQAISYNKGCYLGQEPIVMARDRAGHAPRTLLGLIITDDGPVPSGSKLFRGTEEVGFTCSSIDSPLMGKAVALAYVRYGHQSPGTSVEIETPQGRRAAAVKPLPFSKS
jgi:folate-binding protein YgfZ